MRSIPWWQDAEIDFAIKNYLSNENRLCSIYLPRPFRNSSAIIINEFLKTENRDILNSFSLSEEEKNHVRELEKTLLQSTSTFINKKDRVMIRKFLSLVRNQKKVRIRHIFPQIQPASSMWPNDILDYLDLESSLSIRTLRSDVKEFLMELIERVIGLEPFIIDFNSSVEVNNEVKVFPIVVQVPDDFLFPMINALEIESQNLSVHCSSFLPTDVVKIIEMKNSL